jgi:DNA-binding IclR family transcriptional regulator
MRWTTEGFLIAAAASGGVRLGPALFGLAAMTAAELERVKRRIRLTAVTPKTITFWERLERELQTIRNAGIAYDREENSPGISAISVAIRSPSGELSAIPIPAPTQRFKETEAELAQALLKHCSRLQQKLTR